MGPHTENDMFTFSEAELAAKQHKELTENIVKEIITDLLGLTPGDVLNQSRLEQDLGVDSMDYLEMVLAIEGRFNIEIPDDTILNKELYPNGIRVIDIVNIILDIEKGKNA